MNKRTFTHVSNLLMAGFAVLILALGTGCSVSIVDSESPSEPAAEATPEPALYELIPMEQPNQYRVQFRGGTQVRASSADVILEGGQTFQYELLDSGVVRKIKITVPRDLILADEMNPPRDGKPDWQIETSGRLFMKRGLVLTTEGRRVVIRARALIFESGSLIRTFAKGTTAAAGSAGRSGGVLTLQSHEISGPMTIEMRGENGGSGLQGPAYKEAAAHGSDYDPNTPYNCRDFSLGGRGADGAKGFSGQRGRDGGDTGLLILQSPHREQLETFLTFEPGEGGPGGPGGPGQPGGRGGQNTFVHPVTCMQVRQANPASGPAGNTGAPGEPGEAGSAGNVGQICVGAPNALRCEFAQ